MNETIYSSSNDSLLKSVGPFRIFNTDKSLNLVQIPELDYISFPRKTGEVRTYGDLRTE